MIQFESPLVYISQRLHYSLIYDKTSFWTMESILWKHVSQAQVVEIVFFSRASAEIIQRNLVFERTYFRTCAMSIFVHYWESLLLLRLLKILADQIISQYEIPAYYDRMEDVFGYKEFVCWNKRLIVELKMRQIESFYTSPKTSTSYFSRIYHFWKIDILKFFKTLGTPQRRIS